MMVKDRITPADSESSLSRSSATWVVNFRATTRQDASASTGGTRACLNSGETDLEQQDLIDPRIAEGVVANDQEGQPAIRQHWP
jgi:hypothetical protein